MNVAPHIKSENKQNTAKELRTLPTLLANRCYFRKIDFQNWNERGAIKFFYGQMNVILKFYSNQQVSCEKYKQSFKLWNKEVTLYHGNIQSRIQFYLYSIMYTSSLCTQHYTTNRLPTLSQNCISKRSCGITFFLQDEDRTLAELWQKWHKHFIGQHFNELRFKRQ